jgi:hypothetical protein
MLLAPVEYARPSSVDEAVRRLAAHDGARALAGGMVFSLHPHVISEDGRECLYMQDTWLVTTDGGEPLAGLPMQIF